MTPTFYSARVSAPQASLMRPPLVHEACVPPARGTSVMQTAALCIDCAGLQLVHAAAHIG